MTAGNKGEYRYREMYKEKEREKTDVRERGIEEDKGERDECGHITG